MGKERKGNHDYLSFGLTHLAIIMDGNGRWAEKRGLPRLEGHKQGVVSVETITRECSEMGLSFLTLYSFSTENWKRPLGEVQGLMVLFSNSLAVYGPRLKENNVQVHFLGRREGIPGELLSKMIQLEEATRTNSGMVLNLAINYGGRDEILRAFGKICTLSSDGVKSLDDQGFRRYLDTGEQPDPDIVIRTGGEKRLSNFLLWQAAYAELWFTDILWPEFTVADLHQACREFVVRKRRFGGPG
ncbi:MAG TPA: polyprenyl diphosphate synthase [Atribacteraceae bacterium]|nr:polyprenyl diphosphate synthase [Atribacteraceae bacterium]